MNNVLLIAESANPEWTSIPLEGWSHGRAIQELVGGHLVTQIRNKGAFDRAGVAASSYTAIDSEAIARPLSQLGQMLRGGSDKGWTTVTAIQAIAYPYFEHLVWRAFESRLRAGEFDIVHRITPLSPTMPSPIARKLRELGIPFVIGPLNGGVPWPKQFDYARRREREWLSYVRGAYKLLPGYRSTRRNAAAIICGSKATLEQMPGWCRDKCVYIPENAIDPARFPEPGPKPSPLPLRVAFVGRLVPYKGADMLLEAAAPLVRAGSVVVDIIGDGPELCRLREIIREERIEAGVELAGWVPHATLHKRLAAAHVFGFPSVREFGGAVVLEAMALGLVPVVLNYGGPAELVTPETGFALPLGTRAQVIARFHEALKDLVNGPQLISEMGSIGRERVMRFFTWEAKARQVQSVYSWITGKARKPNLESEFRSMKYSQPLIKDS